MHGQQNIKFVVMSRNSSF